MKKTKKFDAVEAKNAIQAQLLKEKKRGNCKGNY